MTPQAKRAADKLKAAGWNRNQFSVRTERINYHIHPDTGKQVYEYGEVIVSLKNSSKLEQLRMAKKMADQGLQVDLFYSPIKRKWFYPLVRDTGNPSVWMINLDDIMISKRIY